MNITFSKTHRSIETFAALLDLPNFIVLTGLNGSGKTHFLEAIENASIKIDDIKTDDIKLINNRSIKQKASPPHRHNIDATISELCKELNEIHEERDKNLARTSQKAFKENIFIDISHDTIIHLSQNHDNIKEFIAPYYLEHKDRLLEEHTHNILSAHRHDAHYLRSHTTEQLLINNIHNIIACPHKEKPNFNYEPIKTICKKTNKKIIQHLTQGDIIKYYHPETRLQAFNENLSEVFVTYYNLRKFFKNSQIENHKDSGKSLKEIYNNIEQDFENAHGSPPWDVFNKMLTDAKLPFQVTYPTEQNIYANFSAQLVRYNKETIINLDDLSSGETVIFSFITSLFNFDRDGQDNVIIPEMLLLDEIDASLHPMMTQDIMSLILNTLVEKHNVKVIMTTHSPTTIALAPEESIYLKKEGETIQKHSKAQAISELTYGIPMLSIDFTGQRQVLVESINDVKQYKRIYEALKNKWDKENDHISSKRSLKFIGVGSNSGGDGGCKTVLRQLKDFIGCNQSVFGILDWDTNNNPSDRLFILGHKERYAIENFFFDPYLIALYTLKEKPNKIPEISYTHSEFKDLSNNTEIQKILDIIIKRIMAEKLGRVFEIDESSRIEVEYGNSIKIGIDKRYLQVKGHDLAEAIFKAFPWFYKATEVDEKTATATHKEKKLIDSITEKTLEDDIKVLPQSMEQVFLDILEYEAS